MIFETAKNVVLTVAFLTAPAWFLYAARLACEAVAFVLNVSI